MGRAGNTPRGTFVPGFFHGKVWEINGELLSIPDACVQAARGPPKTDGSEEAVRASHKGVLDGGNEGRVWRKGCQVRDCRWSDSSCK